MTVLRPHAWTLPTNHPDLCPGEGEAVYLPVPYNNVVCPTCQRSTTGRPANCAGGGRVNRHYRPSLLDEADRVG